ncbi:atpH, partial [Symbiodinium sp. CCMP2456]
MGCSASCETQSQTTQSQTVTVCYVPNSFQSPPTRALPPDESTHKQYLRELNLYLIRVAKNPDAFQRKVEKRRKEEFRDLWCHTVTGGIWVFAGCMWAAFVSPFQHKFALQLGADIWDLGIDMWHYNVSGIFAKLLFTISQHASFMPDDPAMARSLILTGAVLLCSGALFTAFVAAPRAAPAPSMPPAATAALSAVTLVAPQAAHAEDGAVWIPALSAIGAGFAIGLAAIGSGVGQ